MATPTFFKSVVPVEITHERGIEYSEIEGTVQKIENGRVFLKGMFFEFSISQEDFQNANTKHE